MTLGFDNAVKDLYKIPKVLDVGAGGLDGHNTTKSLHKYFGYANVTCMQIKEAVARDYVSKYPSTIMKEQDFYEYDFKDEKFDLIVLDLNIDNNINRDWQGDGLKKAHSILNPKGIVVCYICHDNSASPAASDYMYLEDLIQKHLDGFWGGSVVDEKIKSVIKEKFPMYKLVSINDDVERDNITWIALQKV